MTQNLQDSNKTGLCSWYKYTGANYLSPLYRDTRSSWVLLVPKPFRLPNNGKWRLKQVKKVQCDLGVKLIKADEKHAGTDAELFCRVMTDGRTNSTSPKIRCSDDDKKSFKQGKTDNYKFTLPKALDGKVTTVSNDQLFNFWIYIISRQYQIVNIVYS